MANYSVNQNRHLYVANNGYVENGTDEATITKVAQTLEKELYFLYNGPDGSLRSDFIPLATITNAVAIDAADNATKMRKVSISLATGINSGAPVVGQDYILGINFKNFFSSGDDSQYYKDAVVHVDSSLDNAKKFFDKMKEALDAAFSREDGATATSNPYLAFSVSGSGSSAKLVIEEKEQDWNLGTKKQRRIMFDVLPGFIYTGGADQCWAKKEATGYYYKEETPSTTVGNGKKVADLEWFCNGERGDQYRGMGYPNYIPFKYYTDPSKEYHLIELHFAFVDSGEASYRSEKEITIAVPKGVDSSSSGGTDATYTAVNAVIGAINTAAGTTLIAQLGS